MVTSHINVSYLISLRHYGDQSRRWTGQVACTQTFSWEITEETDHLDLEETECKHMD